MSIVEIKVTPRTRDVLIKLPKHLYYHKEGMRNSLSRIGREVVRTDQKLIRSPPKTGRWYYIPELKRLHRASAPGQAPANMTGRLAKSASYSIRNHQEMEVGERAPYAKFLELGTKKMKPRPHLIKAVVDNNRNAVKALEENAINAIKGRL